MKRPLRSIPNPTREPKVVTADLQRILMERVDPDEDGYMNVHVVAERAGMSTRTVYRVLEGRKPTTPLDTADRLLIAVGLNLHHVRLTEEGE